MNRASLRHGAALSLLILAARCEEPIDTLGQYIATQGGLDVGLAHMVEEGEFAIFDQGDPDAPDVRAYSVTRLPNNQFDAVVPFGYGLIPLSFSGKAVDIDADHRADRIDILATYEDLHTANLSLVRTDPYDDYRCWIGDLATGIGCRPAAADPDCTFTPLGGLDYEVVATLAFRDGNSDLNPGGRLQSSVIHHHDGSKLTYSSFVGIPGGNGTWTVSATGAGAASGVLTIAGQVHVDPLSVGTILGFSLRDLLGYESQTVGGLAFCPQTLRP